MDLGDGSVGSRCEEEEVRGKDVRLNEIERGINGPNDVSGIGDLGSSVECIKFESLDKSADVGENVGQCPVINGSCGDASRKIVQSVETNGEIVGIEEVVATTSKVVASPLDIIEGLEYAGSQLKSKEVDKVENLVKMVESDEIRLDSDVSVVYETGDFDRTLGLNGKGITTGKTLESPSSANGSPTGDSGVSPNKGFGLRKWRRKRRDGTKDGAGMVDPNRILKRGFSNPETCGLSVENRHKSEGSGSDAYVNSIVKDMVFSALSVGVCDSQSRACDTEYRAAVGTAFAIGTDSENSEDRSSKSTAASAPKLRQEVPPVGGFVKEKNKVKNTKNPGNAVHKAQQGKGKVEASKKLRGDRIKVEKENSYSSVESDLRSSTAVFTEADAFARATYGRQGEGSSNYDGENSDGVQLCELQSSEEVRADYYKENGEEAEVVSRVDVVGCLSKVENKESENQGPDPDPLAESVTLLQAAQEALEKEIENFREIGKEPVSPPDSSSCGASSSAQLPPEEMEDITSAPKEASAAELIQKVSLLEHELQVTTTILKAKELKVLELESILNSTQLPKQKAKDNPTSLEAKQKAKDNPTSLEEICREMEIELEVMFKDKIEAEVEYLLMVRHTQKLKIMAEEQVSLLEQLKTLAENQEKMLMKLRDAEDKGTKLEKQAEELVASSRELLGAEDVLKMQNDVRSVRIKALEYKIKVPMIHSELHSQLNDHIVSNEDNTCYLCGKKFSSDKGLCGHMRLHPNRGWKGIRPPTIADNLYGATQEVTHKNMSNQSGEKLEVEDEKFKPKKVTNRMDSTSEKKQIGGKKEDINNMRDDKPIMHSINRKRKKKTMRAILGKDSGDHYNNNEKKSVVRKKFICVTCKKSFLTHQALGGHRTGHKKDKIENDQHGATVPLLETNESRIQKPHQCKLCDKVFPTGQALGGHQRCHRASPIDDIGSRVTSSKDTRKMDRKQPLNFDLNEPPQGYQEDGLQATSEPPLVVD